VREYGCLSRHETPVFGADSGDHHRQFNGSGHNPFEPGGSSTVHICGMRESQDTRFAERAFVGETRQRRII
jgi:hypothetical protein